MVKHLACVACDIIFVLCWNIFMSNYDIFLHLPLCYKDDLHISYVNNETVMINKGQFTQKKQDKRRNSKVITM